MGASASDIITYIGVPLAVIGVMPVMYTCFCAILIKHRVLKSLKSNNQRLQIVTRTGLLSGVLEIDFPRFTIHPLPRGDDLYWKHTDGPSQLRGGSWTFFQWQTIHTGKRTYRLQHSDELRQPQAEIQLTDLFTFLLDRGASPFPAGLQLLRIMGLQTPPGTRLLVCGSQPVLSVATPDESEGHLSLKLHWTDDMRVRSSDCLPPYWVQIHSSHRLHHGEEEKEVQYPPVRLYLGLEGLETGFIEDEEDEDEKWTQVSEDRGFEHLRPDSRFPGSVSMWFASAAVGIYSQNSQQDSTSISLFCYTIPPRILLFSKRDTVPYGILVLLNLKPLVETPLTIERARLRLTAAQERRHRDLQETARKAQERLKMTPAARARSLAEDGQATIRRMNDERRANAEEELERRLDALNSPRVSTRVVGEAAFDWLKSNDHLRCSDKEEITIHTLAKSLVHSMIFEPDFASSIATMLDAWIGWMDTVMNDAHYDILKRDQVMFCYAAVLLHEISNYEAHGKVSPVAKDLDECQRLWRTVYLG